MNDTRKKWTKSYWRKTVLFVSITSMFAGLLFSRAVLSSGMILFIATCVTGKGPVSQLRTFIASPVLWTMSLLFFLPLLSGLWSSDFKEWTETILVKLPLFLLPFSFAGLTGFTNADWEKVAALFLFIVLGGVCWSVIHYLQDMEAINAGYLQAHAIETPLGNDRIRFSLLVVIALFTSTFILARSQSATRTRVVLLLVLMAVLIVYLHILAVRTGIICFYIGVFIFLSWLIRQRRGRLKYAMGLALVLLLPVISYFIFPSFRNRTNYVKYDLSLIQKKIYRPGSNDGDRFISIKAGWQLLNEHPVLGVGFGDIKDETRRYYDRNYPAMTESDKILPASEWMMYGAGLGWPGFLFLTSIMIVPFLMKPLRKDVAWWLINIFIIASYLFDIGLEVQYGVFIHAFVLLWWYSWLQLREQ